MNMISEYHNYDNGYIALVDLTLPDMPKTVQIADYTLIRKSEFHISLLCAKRLAPLIDPARATEIEAEIVALFLEYIKTNPLTDYALTHEYRLVKLDDRVTLVVLVDVSGIKGFFELLEKKYTVSLPVQATHITLYTLQPEIGIGIFSHEVLEKISHVVTVPFEL